MIEVYFPLGTTSAALTKIIKKYIENMKETTWYDTKK